MSPRTSQQPRHGGVSSPPSRASLYLEAWQAAGLEAGKFFPALNAGLTDPFAPTDVPNAEPPIDGKIASAGQDFAAQLDEPRADWTKHRARAGEALEVVWHFHASHKTRRFSYFLTTDGWNPDKPLARVQFGPEPIATFQNPEQPFWEHDLMPADPTIHHVPLPEGHTGYHVLLAVWEVADTPHAFYQVIDLDLT